MMLAQELAHMRHTGISASLVKGGAELLCVQTHAAELIDMKRTAETANPLLPENGRAAILAPHGDVADQEQGGEYDQGDKGQKTIPIRFTLRSKAVIPSGIKSVDLSTLSFISMACLSVYKGGHEVKNESHSHSPPLIYFFPLFFSSSFL